MRLLQCLISAGMIYTAAAERSPVALKANQIWTLSNTCDSYSSRIDSIVSNVLGMADAASTVSRLYLAQATRPYCPSHYQCQLAYLTHTSSNTFMPQALNTLLTADLTKLPSDPKTKTAYTAAFWVWGVKPPWEAGRSKFTGAETSRLQKAKDI